MERFFGRGYRGDPGIPHTKADTFPNIWIGTAIFIGYSINNPYLWTLNNEYNFHDLAMLHEQYHMRKALEKKKKYMPLWNKHDKKWLDLYYEKWPDYYP